MQYAYAKHHDKLNTIGNSKVS